MKQEEEIVTDLWVEGLTLGKVVRQDLCDDLIPAKM